MLITFDAGFYTSEKGKINKGVGNSSRLVSGREGEIYPKISSAKPNK
jgi:hypothetical protein